MNQLDQLYAGHHPTARRRWRRARCVCGLPLRACPDWRRITYWRRNESIAATGPMTQVGQW